MAELTEPNSGLKWGWDAGESGWKDAMDANLLKLGRVGFHLSVISRTTTAPPGSPADGDRYIVPTGATGAWSANVGNVAVWDSATWAFYPPSNGWRVVASDENRMLIRESGAWVVLIGFCGALVYQTAAQSIPTGVNTVVNWDAETYDTDSIHDNVTNNTRLTVPAGYTWARAAGAAWLTGGAAGTRQLMILKNGGFPRGSAVISTYETGTVSYNLSTAWLQVAPGDYLEAAVYQGSGAAINTNAANMYFSVEFKR